MKIIKLLPILLFLFAINSFGQPGRGGEKREQIKALKIAFVTDELQLTPDEAAKFWPLFNAFEAKQFEIRRQKMKSFIDRMDEDNLDNMSDKEATAILLDMESTEDEQHQLKKKFIASLKGIISPVKIIKLKRAEEKFNKKLLQQYKDRKRD